MLPNGWKKQTIEDCADLLTGYAFRSEDYVEARESAVRLLRGDNIIQGSLRWEDAKHWATPYAEALQRYEMRAGDIVLAMDRPIVNAGLKCSVVRQQDLPSLLVQRVARLRAKKDFDQGYLVHVLQTHRFIEYLRGQKTETAVPHISPNDIREFEFPCPINPDEQHRIHQILSTWDQAIDTSERLLANSRKQCTALLTALVSGRQRLSSYESKWIKTTLQKVAAIVVSSVNKKHVPGERQIRLCNYTDVYYNDRITGQLKFMDATATEAEIAKCMLRVGDVLITKDSETADDIAVSAYVCEEIPNLVCGYHLAIVRPDRNQVEPIFLHAYFSLTSTRSYFTSNANGVTRFGLPIGAIQEAPIHLPPIAEQRRIASLLSICAETIQCQLKELDSLRSQRAALMSQLLTGKRRVKLRDVEAEVQS